MFWCHAHPCLTDRCLWKTFRPSTLGEVYGRRVGDMGTSLVLGLCPYMLLSHQPARKLIRQRLFPLRHSSGRCPGESWLAPPQLPALSPISWLWLPAHHVSQNG